MRGGPDLSGGSAVPDGLIVGLHAHKTQTIPLELLAAAGLMYAFAAALADCDVTFFIDQAVRTALCKGASRNTTSRRSLPLPPTHNCGQAERPDQVRVGAQQGESGGRAEPTREFSLRLALGRGPPSPAALG